MENITIEELNYALKKLKSKNHYIRPCNRNTQQLERNIEIYLDKILKRKTNNELKIEYGISTNRINQITALIQRKINSIVYWKRRCED